MKEILKQFAPITLEEMSSVKLMNRTDTKFVTTMTMLRRLLTMAAPQYYAQEVAGKRIASYNTTYFDTTGYDMYYSHQAGHANRQKIRFRTYVDSDLQFMEVKTKNNHKRTKKKRMEVCDMDLADQDKLDFLAKYLRYDAGSLMPAIQNSFDRITLVNKGKTERLTIDMNLQFHNLVTGTDRKMEDLVIVELKRDGLCYSPVLAMLNELRIHPHGFSKYCMGSALTNHHLKVNRFKVKLIEVEKVLRDYK